MNTEISEETRIQIGNDGHLYANGKRLRILGTNISSVPEKEDAKYWAELLALQGFNCVRFHHLDSDWANAFIKVDWVTGKRSLDLEGLDKIDYFFYELKKVGIYSNINLLTGRAFSIYEGLHFDISKIEWKVSHSLGFFDDKALELQKEYAKWIFTHKNPYTETTYANDPAVAFFEINNENGVFSSFFNGSFDLLSDNLKKSLQEKWNLYLEENKLDYEKLSSAFNIKIPKSRDLINSETEWDLETSGGSKAIIKKSNNTIKIDVKENGKFDWNVALHGNNVSIKENTLYTLKFKAKASENTEFYTTIMMNHEPWQQLGFGKKIALTKKWQEFEIPISSLMKDNNARLDFGGMGFSKGFSFEFKDIEFYEGGNIESVQMKNGKIQFPLESEFANFKEEYKKILIDFLYDLENSYWTEMLRYVKEELHVASLSIGTAIGFAPANIMNKFDVIDNHQYFHHPEFPKNPWSDDYFVVNESITQDENFQTLGNIACTRIFGKPYSISEYNHPYPNQYNAETFFLLASFASFQDWDCVFGFSYDILQKNADDKYHPLKISGYFDQSNNPVQAASFPFAARIFRNFMIKSCEKSVYAKLSSEDEKQLILKNYDAWDFRGLSNTVESVWNLISKTGLIVGENDLDCAEKLKNMGEDFCSINIKENTIDILQTQWDYIFSDTQELLWSNVNKFFGAFTDDLIISVSCFGSDFIKEFADNYRNFPIEFMPEKDFAVFSAIEISENMYIIFSGSWSGNTFQNLREYNSNQTEKRNNFQIIRDKIKITSDVKSGKEAVALGCSGVISVKDNSNWILTRLDSVGNKTEHSLEGSSFKINYDDGTLWYLLEKKD